MYLQLKNIGVGARIMNRHTRECGTVVGKDSDQLRVKLKNNRRITVHADESGHFRWIPIRRPSLL